MDDITQLLDAIAQGQVGSSASQELMPLIYEELRKLAVARMARESPGQTLQPTALVHEAWLELVGEGHRDWKNRAHFFGAASHAMRRIMIQKARHKSRLKHGGGQVRLNLDECDVAEPAADEKLLLVDAALKALEKEDPKQARVVEMKFFGGLTNLDVAQNLGISERSVDREWACAKAWLYQWILTNR